MRKSILAAVLSISMLTAATQEFTSGSKSSFSLSKKPLVTAMANDNEYYFIVKTTSGASDEHSLIVSDRQGNINHAGVIRLNPGSFTNMFEIHSVHVLGNSLIALVENRDKKAGLNRMIIRSMDNAGTLGSGETMVGTMEYEKMMNPGNWFAAVTPDRQQIAILGQLPFEKGQPNRYKYFILDAALKQVSAGVITFPDEGKRLHFASFHASSQGDLYLIQEDFDKGYKYPIIYKASANEKKGTIIPLQFPDASDKTGSYITDIQDDGDLVLTGYYRKKRAVIANNDEEVNGTFIFRASSASLQMQAFDKPVYNMTARGTVRNGNTIFLIGEQFKAEKQQQAQQQALKLEESFTYKHSDILVTAFDESGNRKFQIPLNRNWTGNNINYDLYPAYGVVNGRLALVYNDQYGKYFTGTSWTNSKMPVLVFISNDGLMEQPVNFEKKWETPKNQRLLFPRFFVSRSGELMILAGNQDSVQGVIIR